MGQHDVHESSSHVVVVVAVDVEVVAVEDAVVDFHLQVLVLGFRETRTFLITLEYWHLEETVPTVLWWLNPTW